MLEISIINKLFEEKKESLILLEYYDKVYGVRKTYYTNLIVIKTSEMIELQTEKFSTLVDLIKSL